MRQAVERAGVDVIVSRTRAGVLAYGADRDVRAAFDAYGITDFDLHSIDVKRLRNDSGERGLLRDALSRAIARSRALDLRRRRNSDLFAPLDAQNAVWARLRALVGSVSGSVTGFSDLRWREGISTRLDWANDRLWLLVEPRLVFEGLTEANVAAAADFAREKTVKRYNRELNDLVEFWTSLLAGDGDELRALGVSDGVDATFVLLRGNAFSRRLRV